MTRHQDENGMWHARDLNKGGYDSNVYIYGLYAKLLGLDVSQYPEYFRRCAVTLSRDNIIIHRHPNKPNPPLSFDECIGMVGLDLLDYDILKGNHFVYYGHGERLDHRVFEKLAKGLLEMVMAHNINIFMPKSKKVKQRNLWWERNLENVKYFAVRLTPAYSYIVKRYNGVKPHEEERVLWKFYSENLAKKKPRGHGDYSQKNLLWALHLLNKDEKNARKLKPWVNFERYFGSEHPFTHAIKKKYGIK